MKVIMIGGANKPENGMIGLSHLMEDAEMLAILEAPKLPGVVFANPDLPIEPFDNVSHPHRGLPTVLVVDNVSGMLPKAPIEFPIAKLHSDHDYIGPIKDGRQLRRERRKGERKERWSEIKRKERRKK